MESRANVLAAGLFVIVLTLGLIGVAFWLTHDSLNRAHYQVVAHVAVSGLHDKAAVRLRGVEVGRVEGIGFDPHDRRTVLIDIAVDRDAGLTRGTYGQLALQGVTGLSYIALDDDGTQPEPLAGTDTEPGRIPLRPSLFDGLSDSGRDLLREGAQVARRLNQALADDNLARLAGTLRNTEAATHQIEALAQDLRPAARELQALQVDTRGAITHLDALVGDLRTLTGELGQHLSALDQVGHGAQALGAAGTALQTAVIGDTLPRLDGTLDELARSARELDRLLGRLERQPQAVLFGAPPPRPGPGEPGYSAAQAH